MKRYLVTAPDELQLSTRLEIAPDPKAAKLQASRHWFENGQKQGLSLRHRSGLSSFVSTKRVGLFSCCQVEWSGLTGQLITTCIQCGKQCVTADAKVDEVLDALLMEDLEQSLTTLGVVELLSGARRARVRSPDAPRPVGPSREPRHVEPAATCAQCRHAEGDRALAYGFRSRCATIRDPGAWPVQSPPGSSAPLTLPAHSGQLRHPVCSPAAPVRFASAGFPLHGRSPVVLPANIHREAGMERADQGVAGCRPVLSPSPYAIDRNAEQGKRMDRLERAVEEIFGAMSDLAAAPRGQHRKPLFRLAAAARRLWMLAREYGSSARVSP